MRSCDSQSSGQSSNPETLGHDTRPDRYTSTVGNLVLEMAVCVIHLIVCVVQWTTNKGRGDVTHCAPHISSLHGWLLALYRDTNNACLPACLEAKWNNTWNVWILQEVRLPFCFPSFAFHYNVPHHFLFHSSDLTNLLEHFDSST
jgi:hypothetical protein